jgi:hypothetical protein
MIGTHEASNDDPGPLGGAVFGTEPDIDKSE